jgi:hypothetical protein
VKILTLHVTKAAFEYVFFNCFIFLKQDNDEAYIQITVDDDISLIFFSFIKTSAQSKTTFKCIKKKMKAYIYPLSTDFIPATDDISIANNNNFTEL